MATNQIETFGLKWYAWWRTTQRTFLQNFCQNICNEVGKPVLFNKNIYNPKAVKGNITKTLHDLFIQEWNAKISQSSKGRNYHIFKENIEFEGYLLIPKQLYIPLIKFRTSNHKLPDEVGRWKNTLYAERKYSLCNKNDIGDEFHYLLICPFFQADRCYYLKSFFYRRPNTLNFKALLTSTNKKVLSNLSKFVKIIMNKFSWEK